MFTKNSQTSRAKMHRFQRAIEEIRSLREERGKKARGDFLLRQAQDALRTADIESAMKYLEMFIFISPSTRPEHRAVATVILAKLRVQQKFKIPDRFLVVLNFVVEIIKLVGRNLLSCISTRIIGSGLYKCLRISAS